MRGYLLGSAALGSFFCLAATVSRSVGPGDLFEPRAAV